VIVVDAHLDLAMNALQWNRDLRLSAYVIRTLEQKVAGKGRGLGTVALPELRRGRVALAFATLIARSTGRPVPHIDYSSTAQAYGVAQGQLAYYRALERQG
jgi:membrane dipeptidase